MDCRLTLNYGDRMRRIFAIIGLLAAESLALGLELPLHMEEVAGVDRRDWPVRVGVPFEQGALRDAGLLRLHSPTGQLVGLQTKALCRWPDSSVKWALVDFTGDFGSGQSAQWKLSVADGKAVHTTELVSETQDGVQADTGPLRLYCRPRARNGLFSVRLAGGPDPVDGVDLFLRLQSQAPGPPEQENWLRDASKDAGTVFRAMLDQKRTVSIEENGPIHAVVRIDGWHVASSGRRAFPYTLRVHLWRGSSRLGFQHTFVASELVKENFVREMGAIFPVAARNVKDTAGMPEGWRQAELKTEDALAVSGIGDPRLYHFVSFRERKRVYMEVAHRRAGRWEVLAQGEDPSGWATIEGDGASLGVAFRDFRNLHPKELRVEGDGRMIVYLWPERGGKCLDLRRRSEELDKSYNENGRDPWDGRGIAKTHEWMVEYSRDPISPESARDATRAVDEPIYPYVTPEYYLRTGVFGEFLPSDPESFPRLEAAIAFGFRYLRAERSAFGMDGLIDWGDIAIGGVGQADHRGEVHPKGEGIPWRGYMGWCNSDFSLCHGFFLHYLRTGDREVLKDGEAMAMHVMDIDTEHYCPEEPESVGAGHRHDQQHWGNGFRGYCFAPNAAIDLYLLTGNRRAFDVAREMADYFCRQQGGYGRYMVLRFWEISGEEKYRDAAQRMLEHDLAAGASSKDGWPFAIGANFRSKSYDGVGYTFYDAVSPSPKLRQAFRDAIGYLRPRYVCPWKTKGHPDHCVFALAHRYEPVPENTEALKIAVWLAAKGLPKSASVFDIPSGAPFEQLLQVNRSTIDVGRTDVFGLYYLVGLPRVLVRLKATGVSEDEAVDYEWQWRDAASFAEVLDNSKAFPTGKSWNYYTKNQSPSYRPDARLPTAIQEKWRAAIPRHELYEDGRKLGPHPYSAASQIKYGKKGWTRRLSGAIRFTTPDNSDPRENGRRYVLVYVNEEDAVNGLKPEDLLRRASAGD